MTATIRRTPRRRPVFYALPVIAIDELTEDSVAVTFAVPEPLRDEFAFAAGQHLTIRQLQDGAGSGPEGQGGGRKEDVRRSYSISSTPSELADLGLIRIGIKQITGGVFSSYARTGLRPGDTVEVLPPLGHFTTAVDPTRTRHYGAVAAGSGITPVLSLIATTLATEAWSRFTLLYGNRRANTVMFAEELADLKDRYPDRLQVVHVLSREPQMSALLSGRIDAGRLRAIFDSGLVDAASVDEWFLCGPYGLVLDAQGVLAERAVPDRAVHSELFHVDSAPPSTAPVEIREAAATATILLDGRESHVDILPGERVLDAALRVRSELPYACKGGVCSTCRAKLVEGEVAMAQNYALEPDELAAGYILTCQSTPTTDRLVIDYDA